MNESRGSDAFPAVKTQTAVLFGRLAIQQMRSPTTYINLVIALFFLAVYEGAFGGSKEIERLTGASFLTFILPVVILNAAIGGSISGQALVADLESGYFRRLLTLPVSRTALVLAPMLFGALIVTVQAVLVLAIGCALGAGVQTGLAGAAVLVLFALLWGLAFAGYSVATALLTRNAAATQTASFIFFPLIFLAPTFLPREALQGWLRVVSAGNPTTYVLEAMRSLMIVGWDEEKLAVGFAVIGGFSLLTLVWATRVARRTTERA